MKNKGIKEIILASILALLTFSIVIPFISADPDDYANCGMMNGFSGSYGTTFMIISWITAILLIALIGAGIYWLIKSANKK